MDKHLRAGLGGFRLSPIVSAIVYLDGRRTLSVAGIKLKVQAKASDCVSTAECRTRICSRRADCV